MIGPKITGTKIVGPKIIEKDEFMDEQMTRIDPGEPFSFGCDDSISCFTDCCRDLNQFLTPYDILRLKRHPGIDAGTFLHRYTEWHAGPESGLPVVVLRPIIGDGMQCPFVTQKGCTVYENRPSSCRTYPLARLLSRNRDTGRIQAQFFMLAEDHCRGFALNHQWTIEKWIENQGLAEYYEMDEPMIGIIALKNRNRPGRLDAESEKAFMMACYQLEEFRDFLEKDPEYAGSIPGTDTELLRLGFRWIKKRLFGI